MKFKDSVFALLLLLPSLGLAQATPRPAAPTAKPATVKLRSMATTQTGHYNQLAWDASTDSTTTNPGTVTVLKQAGACPANGGPLTNATELTISAAPAGPYTDNAATLVAGQTNCYAVFAVIGGISSNQSNTLQLTTPTFPPTSLTGTAY